MMAFKFCRAVLTVLCIVSPSLKAAEVGPLLQSPIGDNIHVEVYDFILQELKAQGNIPLLDIENIRKEEQQATRDGKPYTAGVIESSFSHLLSTLCKGTPGCLSLGVYQKEGLLIGYGSLKDDLPSSAFLGNKPLSSLGVQRVGCQEGTCDYLITWAVYLPAALSLTPLPKESTQLVGFVRFFKRISE